MHQREVEKLKQDFESQIKKIALGYAYILGKDPSSFEGREYQPRQAQKIATEVQAENFKIMVELLKLCAG
jgi:hypothetical protein